MTQVQTDNRDLDRQVLNSLTTKSAKVRYLHGLGFSRSEISLILFIRYQHVRNILITPLKKV